MTIRHPSSESQSARPVRAELVPFDPTRTLKDIPFGLPAGGADDSFDDDDEETQEYVDLEKECRA
jgi:hypothetical protein